MHAGGGPHVRLSPRFNRSQRPLYRSRWSVGRRTTAHHARRTICGACGAQSVALLLRWRCLSVVVTNRNTTVFHPAWLLIGFDGVGLDDDRVRASPLPLASAGAATRPYLLRRTGLFIDGVAHLYIISFVIMKRLIRPIRCSLTRSMRTTAPSSEATPRTRDFSALMSFGPGVSRRCLTRLVGRRTMCRYCSNLWRRRRTGGSTAREATLAVCSRCMTPLSCRGHTRVVDAQRF